MSGRDPILHAGEVQRAAAVPDRSVALRASAGSGKTRVLVDRFVRLCVEGERNDTHPRSILAVTFTRKAATEISERLLARARTLALAPADERESLLAELFAGRPAGPPRPAEVDRAARLYERLLEDTGGLQIGTIHSFCQRILARFAAEAGLDPHARLIEDREDLLDETLDRIEVLVAADSALADLARDLGPTPGSLRLGLRAVFAQQMRLDRWIRRVAGRAGTPPCPRLPHLPVLLDEVRAFLFPGREVAEVPDAADFLQELDDRLAGFAARLDDEVAPRLEPETLDKVGKALATLRDGALGARTVVEPDARIAAARDLIMTKAGDVRRFSRAGTAAMKEEFQTAAEAAAGPLLETLRLMDLTALYRRNRARLGLGLRALDVLDEFKQRDRVVDFGDLEDMACRLMGDEARALSLLFRLEDSIRHVLVDEFQDTNFNQMDILAPFVREFLSGGTGDFLPAPTVFLVGDVKQSIYGFRGAEPGIFAGLLDEFAGRDLPVPTLPTNFRSLPAVVGGVGRAFLADPLQGDLPAGEAEHVAQEAARGEADGVLLVPAAFDEEPGGRTGDQVAADAAARLVRELVDGGSPTWEGFGPPLERPLTWGDVLVLYRARTGISLYEQAFRAAGIPIEPAGRGMLAAGREVQDLLALLRWLVWTDDDAALATVLRSPLFRLPETAFGDLLVRRGLDRSGPDGSRLPPRTLWRALREAAPANPLLEPIGARLEAWRADAGIVGCHELLRRIYREGEVLARYERAGGLQGRYDLERLYDLALGPEAAGVPTVRRFIDLVAKAGRRGGHDEGSLPENDGAGRVRFMTVHGAKGLEAPVVLLVDADRAPRDRGTEVRLNPTDHSSGLVFGADRSLRRGIAGTEDLLTAAADAAARAAAVEENNLLYVAMTRARDRLYVIGGRSRARDEDLKTPLARLRLAMEGAQETTALEDPAGWSRPPGPVAGNVAAADAAAPVRLWTPPPLGERLRTVTPSADLGEPPPPPDPAEAPRGALPASADPGLSPREHGNLVHRLLQLSAETGAAPAGDSPAHLEAAAAFGDPDLAWIFDPAAHERALCEVPVIHRTVSGVTGRVEERTVGAIDRLVLRPGRVDVIDYKTNRMGGDTAHRDALVAHYRPQLEAYRAAVAGLFPDREVHAWLLFTDPDRRRLVEVGES